MNSLLITTKTPDLVSFPAINASSRQTQDYFEKTLNCTKTKIDDTITKALTKNFSSETLSTSLISSIKKPSFQIKGIAKIKIKTNKKYNN